jgi:homogentisate 1,2-dioxygenase
MPPYLRLGSIPRKRHIAHPQPGGHRNEGIYYEEVLTTAGFSRGYSIAYHLRPPTRVTRLEPAGTVPADFGDESVLRHHHVKTRSIARMGDPVSGRVAMFRNDDVTIARCRPDKPQEELFRNVDADEIIFVHSGRGVLSSMFGPLPFREFDYVVVPRCTTYRLDFEAASGPDLLVIESAGSITIPARYLNTDAQLKLGAPFSERDLHGPRAIDVIDREEETVVLVKDCRRLTRYTLASHPFDVVG